MSESTLCLELIPLNAYLSEGTADFESVALKEKHDIVVENWKLCMLEPREENSNGSGEMINK